MKTKKMVMILTAIRDEEWYSKNNNDMSELVRGDWIFISERTNEGGVKKAELTSSGRVWLYQRMKRWKCEECGKLSESSFTITQHLKKEHGYPQEDAETSTLEVKEGRTSREIIKDMSKEELEDTVEILHIEKSALLYFIRGMKVKCVHCQKTFFQRQIKEHIVKCSKNPLVMQVDELELKVSELETTIESLELAKGG